MNRFSRSGPRPARPGFAVRADLVILGAVIACAVWSVPVVRGQTGNANDGGDGRFFLGTGGTQVAPRPPAPDSTGRTSTRSRERQVAPVWPPRLPGTTLGGEEAPDDSDDKERSPGGLPNYSPRIPSTTRTPGRGAVETFPGSFPSAPGDGTEDSVADGTTVDLSDPERLKTLTAKALMRQRNLELARKRYQASRRLQSEAIAPFEPIPLTATQLKDGWCRLFDGKTFLGWRVQNDAGSPYAGGRFFRKRSEEGVVFCDPAKPGLLYTTGQFGNVVISLEYQCPKDAEILLLLRSPPSPRDLHTSCYAVVLNSEYRRRGAILGRQEGVFDDALSVRDREDSEDFWHQCIVILDGETVKVMIDRNEAVLLNDLQPLGFGHIGLLVARGPAKFRDILWRPATPLALFDEHPSTMENWTHVNLSGGESFSREQLPYRVVSPERTLRFEGAAVLEHELAVRNFTLQVDYRLDEGAEGGVFFRAHARQPQTGYECSLRSPEEPEVPLPKGYRAGGLRGLAEARPLVGETPEWNTLTVNVIDRHVQTWLNGIPVCDWGDRRPATPLDQSSATADVPLSARVPYLDPGVIQLLSRARGKTVEYRNVRITPVGNRFYDDNQGKSESWARQAERFRNERLQKRSDGTSPSAPENDGR